MYKEENYNPSTWNVHQVAVELLDEDGYSGIVILEIGGNIRGRDVIDSIIQMIEDGDYYPIKHQLNERHIATISDEGYPEEYALYNEKGDKLLYDASDISDYVVGVNIISYRDE
ncbi:hypothetical protein ACYCSU_17195 [Paenibacillus sp. ALE1]